MVFWIVILFIFLLPALVLSEGSFGLSSPVVVALFRVLFAIRHLRIVILISKFSSALAAGKKAPISKNQHYLHPHPLSTSTIFVTVITLPEVLHPQIWVIPTIAQQERQNSEVQKISLNLLHCTFVPSP